MTQNGQTEERLAQKQSTKNVCEEKTEGEYAGWKGREQRTDNQKAGGVRRQSRALGHIRWSGSRGSGSASPLDNLTSPALVSRAVK